MIVLLYIILKKKGTNTASRGTFDIALGNYMHALRAQATDQSQICKQITNYSASCGADFHGKIIGSLLANEKTHLNFQGVIITPKME